MQKLTISFFLLILFFLSSTNAQKLSYPQREALKRQQSNMKEIERDRMKYLQFFTEIVNNPDAFKQQQLSPAQLEEWIRNWKQVNEKLDNVVNDLTKNQCPDSDADVAALKTKVNQIRETLNSALKILEEKKNPSTSSTSETTKSPEGTNTEGNTTGEQKYSVELKNYIEELQSLQNKLEKFTQALKEAQDPESKLILERASGARKSIAFALEILEGKVATSEVSVTKQPQNPVEKQPDSKTLLTPRQREAIKRQERNMEEIEGYKPILEFFQNMLQNPEAFKKTACPLKDLQQHLHNAKTLINKLENITNDLKKNNCTEEHPEVATLLEKVTKYNSLFSDSIILLQERITTEITQTEAAQTAKQPEVQLDYRQKEAIKRQERNMAEVEANQKLIEYCQNLLQNPEAFKKNSYSVKELQQTISSLESLNRKLESITTDLKTNACPEDHPQVVTLQEKAKTYNSLFSNSLTVLQDVLKRETAQIQAQERAAQELLARQKTFINECRPFWPSLEKLTSQKYDWNYGSLHSRTETFQQCMKDCTELEKIINTKYTDLPDPIGMNFTSDYEKPSLYRKALAQYQESALRIAESILSSVYGRKLTFIREKLTAVENHSGGGTGIYCYKESNSDPSSADTVDIVFNQGQKTLENLKKAIQQLYQPLGKSPESSPLLVEMQQAIGVAQKAFHTNLPPVSVQFPCKDAGIEAFCKSYIEKTVPGATVIQTGVLEEGWKISKNSLDIPECRLRWAGVVFKEAQTGLYAYSALQYAEDYSGGGQYNSSGRISGLYGAVFGYYYCKGE